MFELSHLTAFLAVAEELNFTRAAERLNLSQPPLSRQIQGLERALGVPLFLRSSRSVQLTPAGRVFMAEARRLLQQADAAAKAARRAMQPQAGALTLSMVGATTYSFLPWLIGRAAALAPDVALDFREMMTGPQLEALHSGRVDIGIIRSRADLGDLRARPVWQQRLVLAIPAGWPMAARRRPALAQLDGADFIQYSAEGPYLREMILRAFQRAGVRPRVVQEVSQAQSILSMVSAGLGLAIVPEDTARACFDNVVLRPIDLGGGEVAEFHAVWRPGNRNPALTAGLALLEPPAKGAAALR